MMERDYSTPPEVSETPKPFRELKEAQSFYLRPAKYIGLTFIKTGPHMAELETWDDHAPKQSFAGDELVYPVLYKMKAKT